MFLLITGASGVGKTTIRKMIQAEFASMLDAAELAELAGPPEWTLRWRHEAVEKAVRRALVAQHHGRHFLLCGDPVPPGEVYAAPSADQLHGLAVCLLDASENAQRSRLIGRGDDPALLVHHVAFADWMREHVADPTHRPDVITQNGWDQMRWDRWMTSDPESRPWSSHVIDTSERSPAEVAALVSSWIRGII